MKYYTHFLEGIGKPDTVDYQALAVHPDYILREDIMETLRDRWLSLSPAGWHFVVTGLLRQHQFELALDHIAQMKMKNIPIENWLHSLLVYNLCDIEDFDEVLRLMKSRTSQGIDITLDLWYYVLDAASEAVHYKTARYVWRRMVELGYLRPPYGVCRNVLTTAAREGDVALAVSIFRYLEEIGAPRGLEEHEKMSEAHLVSGNLHSAFEALCTMHTSGIALEGSSTRSILTFMIEAKTTPRAAWDILKQLRSLKYDIPTGCANVVIELCGTKAGHDPSVVDDGVTFYKELYTLCAAGADAATYSSLLNMCRKAHKREEATFILKEMAAFGVLPDDQTFEHVILMCLDGRNFMSAFYYFQDLVKRGGSLSEAGTVQVRNTCSTLSDWFSVQLRYHPLIRGNVVRRYPEEGEQEAKQPGEEMPATRPVTSKPRNTIQKPRRQNLSQEAIRHQRVAMKLRIAERRRQKIARRLRALPVPLRSPIMIPKTPQEQSTRAIQRQQMSRERRIVLNKNRRKRKRTLIAIKKRRGELWIDDAEAEDHAEPKGSTGSMGSPGSTESRDKGN